MRPVVSAITAVAVLLHVLLGCCLHHGHAAELQNHGTSPAAKHCDHHGHAHHHHSHAHGTPAETPSQPGENSHDDCHENHCNFLLTGKTTFVPDESLSMLSSLAVAVTLEGGPTTAESAPIPRGTITSRLPLRLYLCHQAFLN